MDWRSICVASLLALGVVEARESMPWRAAFDGNAQVREPLPRFRQVNQEMIRSTGQTVNLGGLDQLRMSGSGQFTPQGLDLLIKQIKAPIKDVVLLDLRAEPHAFLNGSPIFWRPLDLRIAINALPSAPLLQLEGKKIQEYLQQEEVEIWRVGDDQWLNRTRIAPKTGETEEHIALEKGIRYNRVALAENTLPQPQQIDELVRVVRSIDGNDWLHIHDGSGQERTTFVMSMVDMMFNARSVPFIDIITRQYTLGGSNFMQKPIDPEWDPQPWDRYYPPSEIVPPYRNDGEMWGDNMLGNNPLFQNDPSNPFFVPYDPMVFEFEIPGEDWGSSKEFRERLDLLQNFYAYCREEQKKGFHILYSAWIHQGIEVELSAQHTPERHAQLLRATWRVLFQQQGFPASGLQQPHVHL